MGLADPMTMPIAQVNAHVSILVLMDGARRLHDPKIQNYCSIGFNPCFDGWGSPTLVREKVLVREEVCFNPCFDGWGSPTPLQGFLFGMQKRFNPCFDGWGSPTWRRQRSTREPL